MLVVVDGLANQTPLHLNGDHSETGTDTQDHTVNQRTDLGDQVQTEQSHANGAADEQSARQIKAEKPELMDRLTAYVETHYAEAISAEKLGRLFYVSSSTVSHLFKEKMGVSFYCYVTQRRLIAAKSLIEKGLLLENVAAQTGFSDYSGFFRAFKREYGISPRQYRSLQENAEKIHL